MGSLKEDIAESTKIAMKSRDKTRVAVFRLVNSEIKRVEVDERRELSDNDIESILTKMVKQRRDSIEQFDKADRVDLSDQEKYEIGIIDEFLPEQIGEQELDGILDSVIEEELVLGPKEMGRVMSILKSRFGSQIDMGLVSRLLKSKLSDL